MEAENFTEFLTDTAALHSHLCPRQVLGVRIGMAGLAAFGLTPRAPVGQLLVILETDGCFADAVQVVTGVSLGQHRLRVEDYGKVAATFVDVRSQAAVRIVPRNDVRERAMLFAPDETRHYFAQLKAYQIMPDNDLLFVETVALRESVNEWLSRPGLRVNCDRCGEEILNKREVRVDGMVLCRACAGQAYYQPVSNLDGGKKTINKGKCVYK